MGLLRECVEEKRWRGREELWKKKIVKDKEELDGEVEVGADMGRGRPW